MVSIEIDGHIYRVPEQSNLLQACLSLGLDLPYFCWHPALGSVGACRQCAVVQYQDRHDEAQGDQRDEQGRIVMSCMTPVSEGMRVSIKAESARHFRADIIELLMINHPHDCPVCEEGGECHLQDMTEMSGHTYRRYRGKKRTHRNQYLGPFINHEMNRCIACYRCVRYYQDYAGGHDLQVMASHHHVYFGRHEDGVLENEFSGNLVEVCPTGVFTDRTLSRHYSRKWDLQTAPSICVHCAVGCNTSPGERYGQLRRIVNRYNGQVNGYFLCDRGRFGYDFVNRIDRVTQVEQAPQTGAVADTPEVLSRTATGEVLAQAVAKGRRLLGVGSGRASVEANFALRELVGEANFCVGLDKRQWVLHQAVVDILRRQAVRVPELAEMEQADAVLILGEDVTNTAPRVALSLRQTAHNRGQQVAQQLKIPLWQDAAVREALQTDKTPIFSATITATRIDDIAAACHYGTPADIAQLGYAVAHAIDPQAPAAQALSPAQQPLVQRIAETLQAAERPLVISGAGCNSLAVIEAAANIAMALTARQGNAAALWYGLPECNSMGLGLLATSGQAMDLERMIEQLESDQADVLIVLENDLSRRLSEAQRARIDQAGKQLVVLDQLHHATAQRADLLLPAATFAEAGGTLVSSSGRGQRFFAVYPPQQDVRPSWEWLADMIALRNDDATPRWQSLDELTGDCAQQVPALAGIMTAAPAADYRIGGMKVARQPHRYSGRTAMLADRQVAEPQRPEDSDSALGFTMEGFPGPKPPALTPFYWAPGWNSNQSVHKFQQQVNGPLQGGDPGVRLITTEVSGRQTYFAANPDEIPGQGDWLLLPAYHIFGSDELSALAAPIMARLPLPYVIVAPESATGLDVQAGDGLRLQVAGQELSLAVVIREDCPAGALIIPAGFSETAGLPLLSRVNAQRDTQWVRRAEEVLLATDREVRP